MALLLISGHLHKDDVGNLLNMNARTIYNWFLRFASEGFSWLLGYHYRGRGRKPKLAKYDKAKVSFVITLAKGKNAPAFPVHLNAIVHK
jgi:hypothetical protein